VAKYPLTGVRAATTRPQERLIARAHEVLATDHRVVAAWLVGTFAVGGADAWSDVDLQCAIDPATAEWFGVNWQTIANEIAPTVAVTPFGGGTIGGFCITPDWVHFDIVFNPADAVTSAPLVGIKPLFDRTGLLLSSAEERAQPAGEPFYPWWLVNFFLYMLGNMVTVVGRNEVIPGTNGVLMCRDTQLIALFLAEQGRFTTREPQAPGNPFPFTKRLRPYLSDEQNQILESLPPLAPTIESVIEGYLAVARAFLPRAKRLAEATNGTWPSEYVAATQSYLERALGMSVYLGV
jgi:hypothetical protein